MKKEIKIIDLFTKFIYIVEITNCTTITDIKQFIIDNYEKLVPFEITFRKIRLVIHCMKNDKAQPIYYTTDYDKIMDLVSKSDLDFLEIHFVIIGRDVPQSLTLTNNLII